jgi:hypothetical protein
VDERLLTAVTWRVFLLWHVSTSRARTVEPVGRFFVSSTVESLKKMIVCGEFGGEALRDSNSPLPSRMECFRAKSFGIKVRVTEVTERIFHSGQTFVLCVEYISKSSCFIRETRACFRDETVGLTILFRRCAKDYELNQNQDDQSAVDNGRPQPL